ncbi:Hypothetical Protein MfeM64YM_0561 [Mycoplasmopsis fermentans M64]|uniref:Uncharacterized protein n=1 Tax=Mycoplasmopsis fermentans (strain M64) TaxID=943945 RepID=A0AB32XC82_MYCFM|nr:Hypothetical Protein MfeM64YM_0561 [Mycoplasmopsis fermentans M64]
MISPSFLSSKYSWVKSLTSVLLPLPVLPIIPIF